MAERPLTWEAIVDFTRLLGEILPENGYFTSAGEHVTNEPSQLPDTVPAAIAVVLESLAVSTAPAVARTHRLATILIVGKIAVDNDNPQLQAHRLICDIQKCIANRSDRFGEGRHNPVFVSANPIPAEPGMTFAGAELRYTTHVRIG